MYLIVLGLLFFFVALLSLKRGRIYAGGTLTRSKIVGKGLYFIAIPQAFVGLAVASVGFAKMQGIDSVGRFSKYGITVLILTYLITNFGIGGILQLKSVVASRR